MWGLEAGEGGTLWQDVGYCGSGLWLGSEGPDSQMGQVTGHATEPQVAHPEVWERGVVSSPPLCVPLERHGRHMPP